MDSSLIFAAVTAALCEHVRTMVQRAVPAAVVRIGPPPDAPENTNPEVTLCLYRIVPSATNRQHALPPHTPGAAPAPKPASGFDLHYFIAFRGNEPLAAELVMGAITLGLDAEPVLNSDQIAAALQADPVRRVFTGCNAADLPLRLEVIAEALTLEQNAALWSRVPASAHPLLLHYLVRLVGTEA